MSRGRVSILRNAVKAFVWQHPNGVEFTVLQQQFRTVDRFVLRGVLYNLRQEGQVHNVKRPGHHGDATWKRGRDPVAPVPVSGKQAKEAQRAREADQRDPLVFYGQGLRPARCPSVWAYAHHFQELRA